MRYQITCKVQLKLHPGVPLELVDTIEAPNADIAWSYMMSQHRYRYVFTAPGRVTEIR